MRPLCILPEQYTEAGETCARPQVRVWWCVKSVPIHGAGLDAMPNLGLASKKFRAMRMFLLLLLLPLLSFAQDGPPIAVFLLGTFHYGSTTDASRTDFYDLYSPERQAQLDTLADRIAAAGIDKVFIEREPRYQARYDSLYALYRAGQLTDTTVLRPEEVQLGFRVAERSGLPGVICSDYKQELPYDRIARFDSVYADKVYSNFFSGDYPFTERDSLSDLARQSLTDYYLTLNNRWNVQRRLYDYLHYAMLSVEGDDYTGPEFSAVWYERNLKIFANILNGLTGAERTIFVLYGASHADVLRDFFAGHRGFRVVGLGEVLGGG